MKAATKKAKAADTAERHPERVCFMLKNPFCGFADNHTLNCAQFDKLPDKQGGGRVRCEDGAEQHAHFGHTCMNVCGRHGELAEKHGAALSPVDYVQQKKGAAQ